MSFNANTVQWIAIIFILYTIMVVVLPYFVLRKILDGRRTAHKFLICVVAGNFFYIMIVQIWGSFHITNRYILIATTLAIPFFIVVRKRKLIWKQYIEKGVVYLLRFLKRENSFRYTFRKIRIWIFKRGKLVVKPLIINIKNNLIESVIFVGCSAAIFYYFSITNHFGPRASDLAVHMLWINEVDKGNLFGGGVYPFGMHSLLYYIHAVFDIPTARIVLLFGTVQVFYIFTMLLVFLKELCRWRYTPYIAYFAFVAGDYIQGNRYSRYYSALPQEFGIIFLLPCAVALIEFFRAIKRENDEIKKMREQKLLYTQIQAERKWKESTVWLGTLVISFGLTFSAHFYITIIAVFVLLAVAIVYIKYLFQWHIFRRLVLAAVIAILIPVMPMAVAFAGGTPLEGSLYWALEVMGIGAEEEEEQTVQETTSVEKSEVSEDESAASEPNETANQSEEKLETQQQVPSIKEKVLYLMQTARQSASNLMRNLIFQTDQDMQVWLICIAVLAVEIMIMWLLREWEQSRSMLMILIYNGFLVFLGISGYLGLPVLLDENRSSIFLSYTLLVCISLALDGILVIGVRMIHFQRFWQAVALGMFVAFLAVTVKQDRIRIKTVNASSLQTDGAVVCVFSIMENYPEKKWTIVSCNEERNMVSPVAWHYEVIDFLESMEDYQIDDEMYIPTQYVFFFIEKDVINYAIGDKFEDVDGRVSEEWAAYDLPHKNGLSQYQSYQRIIVNSRMYYWAEEYRKRFPNEMKIYYEDDSFICYVIEQNEYYLNNFAIDYGYNSGG